MKSQMIEEKVSALPHFAKAAAYTTVAASMALGAGMAPMMYPDHPGKVLLGVAFASAGAMTCMTFAALEYGQGAACRYAKDGAFAMLKNLLT